jgi:hypothetical protein
MAAHDDEGGIQSHLWDSARLPGRSWLWVGRAAVDLDALAPEGVDVEGGELWMESDEMW